MRDIGELDQLLQEQHGFQPVDRHEVEEAQRSMEKNVIEPILRRIMEEQEELNKVRILPLF